MHVVHLVVCDQHNVRKMVQSASLEKQKLVLLHSAVARGGAGKGPIIVERWNEKSNNRQVSHIYELVFKIGYICSDFEE